MNQADQGNNYDSLNLPANKKAKAIQKRRAAENTVEAKKQQRSAAIYLRISSEMQLDGFSIEAQKNACLKYANDQGYEVTEDHMYIDEAYSAKNEERPAFKRMIVAAHSCEFSLIIIHKMDRFKRNFRAMTNTLEDLTNIGVRVFSISENLELANTLTVNLFGIINEHYLQNLSWETAKGKHQAAKEGYHLGSRVPFGYEVNEANIYIDEAFSAKNEERPAFKRMIIVAHSCEFSLIIIHKMDRFERNFRAMCNTLEDLTNIGVRVFSISENLELANNLTVNLFGIINEHYLQNLSWETAKGKHQAAKEGYFIGSRVPFGYRKWKPGDPSEMDKRLLLKDEREAPALKQCFEKYAAGNCSFMDLANFLNENGFISRSGRPFRDDTLRTMLENPIYIGIIEYQGTGKDNYLTYRAKHTPLVSEDLFNRVAEVREKRGLGLTRTKYNAENLKAHYLVQNLICCESCRRKLRVFTTEYSCNYKDYSEERGLECKDSGKQILAPFLDGLVTDFLSSIILPRNWVDKIIAKGSEADTCREIKEQINRIRNRMERRCDAYTVFGTHQNFEKYEREQNADQQQIDDLTQKLPKDSSVINTQITLTTSLIDLFIRATKAERYDIVHFLFSKLYVDLDSHCLTAFEPQAEFEFLFSAFAEENGWKKDGGGRYLLPVTFSASYKEYLEKRSEQTQKKKGKTIKSHRYQAAAQGYFTNSSVPFGYKKSLSSDSNVPDARILLIDSPAAGAVRKCFDLYSSGKYTYDELADMLNRRGFLTSKGKPFSRQNIYCMLKNQVYIGQIVYKDEIYSGRHEAIISRELWDRVQEITELLPDYVYYLFSGRDWEAGTNKAVMGKTLNKATLSAIRVRIHSVEEQKQIVRILDRIKSIIDFRKQQLQTLDDLIKARFVEMFGDPKLNPNGYPAHQLSEHIQFLTSGSRGWAEYCVGNGSEWFITIKNVKDCHITTDNMQPINAPDNAEAMRTRVQEGDLLISITADLGRTGVVTKEIADHGAYINQHLTCIRLDRKVLEPLYVAYFMESSAGKEQFISKNQSAVKAGLNFNSINTLRVIVPPLTIQQEFLRFVTQVDKSKVAVQKALDESHLLFDSLMQQYFG